MSIYAGKVQVGDLVRFNTLNGPTVGAVFRIWGTRAVNLSIQTDDGKVFVRLAKECAA